MLVHFFPIPLPLPPAEFGHIVVLVELACSCRRAPGAAVRWGEYDTGGRRRTSSFEEAEAGRDLFLGSTGLDFTAKTFTEPQ